MTNQKVFQLAGGAAIVGALLFAIATLLRPRVSDPTDSAVLFRAIAESDLWAGTHVAILLAGFLMMGGLYAFLRAIHTGVGPELARMGFIGALVGGGIFSAWVGVSGFAMKEAAERWMSVRGTEEEMIASRVTEAISQMELGLLSLSLLILFGATFILYGLAVASGGDSGGRPATPRWAGWLSIAAGIGSALVGLFQIYNGPSALVTNVLAPAFMLVVALCVLGIGGIVVQKSFHPPGGGPPGGVTAQPFP